MKKDSSESTSENLAPPKREPKYISFRRLVREAFFVEYGAKTQVEIARIIGKTTGAVSQHFTNVASLQPETIDTYLQAIGSERYKRAILQAWIRERFHVDLFRILDGPYTGKKVTEQTLEAIDMQSRTGRLERSVRVAMEAFEKASDVVLQERLLDTACLGFRKLGQLGKAMGVAALIVQRARTRGDKLREASGQYSRARILLSMLTTEPGDVQKVFDRIDSLLHGTDRSVKLSPKISYLDDFILATGKLTAQLTFMERGLSDVDETALRKILSWLAEGQKQKLTKGQSFIIHLLTSRAHLLLGETFQAQEHLDVAYNIRGEKLRYAADLCGQHQGMILEVTSSPEKVKAYLLEIIAACNAGQDRYLEFMIEQDLARLEDRTFPA